MQNSSQIVTTNKPTPNFLQAGYPSFCQTNSVRAVKAKPIPSVSDIKAVIVNYLRKCHEFGFLRRYGMV